MTQTTIRRSIHSRKIDAISWAMTVCLIVFSTALGTMLGGWGAVAGASGGIMFLIGIAQIIEAIRETAENAKR